MFFLFGGLVFFMFSFLVLKRMHSAKQNQEKMNICTNEKQKLKDFTTKSLPLDDSKWQTGVRTDRKTVRGKKSAEETATVQNHLWVIIPRRLYSFWANIKVPHQHCADEASACMNTTNMLTHCEATVAISSPEPFMELCFQLRTCPVDLYYINLLWKWQKHGTRASWVLQYVAGLLQRALEHPLGGRRS